MEPWNWWRGRCGIVVVALAAEPAICARSLVTSTGFCRRALRAAAARAAAGHRHFRAVHRPPRRYRLGQILDEEWDQLAAAREAEMARWQPILDLGWGASLAVEVRDRSGAWVRAIIICVKKFTDWDEVGMYRVAYRDGRLDQTYVFLENIDNATGQLLEYPDLKGLVWRPLPIVGLRDKGQKS